MRGRGCLRPEAEDQGQGWGGRARTSSRRVSPGTGLRDRGGAPLQEPSGRRAVGNQHASRPLRGSFSLCSSFSHSNVQGDSQTSICITIEPGLLLKGDILVSAAPLSRAHSSLFIFSPFFSLPAPLLPLWTRSSLFVGPWPWGHRLSGLLQRLSASSSPCAFCLRVGHLFSCAYCSFWNISREIPQCEPPSCGDNDSFNSNFSLSSCNLSLHFLV